MPMKMLKMGEIMGMGMKFGKTKDDIKKALVMLMVKMINENWIDQ